MDDNARLLKEGIRAAKARQREKARTLLMQVIEADDRNEQAWLWLSVAVATDEERRTCLENVLTINPDNKLARKGLARLQPVEEEVVELPASFTTDAAQEVVPEPISEVSLPPSLEARAARIIGLEPEAERGWWVETPVVEEPLSQDTAAKQFHDVWAGHEELCAFCAEPTIRTQSHCAKCERPLIGKTFINVQTGRYYGRLVTWLIVFLVLRVIGIILVVLFANDIAPGTDYAALLTESIASFVPMVVAAVGIFRREVWAYWLLLVASILETGLLAFIAFSSGNPFVLVCMSPLLALSSYILFTIYMAGEDFQKMPVRRIAAVSDRLKKPADLDKVARQLAREGKWASAVLHWQRAVGRASGHAPFMLRLGHAYAQLGFYERSLDMLQSALEVVRNSETRQKIEQELVRVTRLSQGAGEEQPA